MMRSFKKWRDRLKVKSFLLSYFFAIMRVLQMAGKKADNKNVVNKKPAKRVVHDEEDDDDEEYLAVEDEEEGENGASDKKKKKSRLQRVRSFMIMSII